MDPESVPTADEIFAWIEEIYSWGIRRPAWDADRKAEETALAEFRRLGLENVRAEHWSKQPAESRPHRLVFLLNAGHMVGGAGCHGHRDKLEDIVLSIHLEHTANECREEGGKVVTTGRPEPRAHNEGDDSHD